MNTPTPSPYSDPRYAPPVGPRSPAVPYVRAGQRRPLQGFAPTQYARPAGAAPQQQQSPQQQQYGPGGYAPLPQSPYVRQGAAPQWHGPQNGAGNLPPGPPQSQTPPEPKTPWWQRDGVISRLLAGLGVLITLIGVVMMLVLAAQAGYFGPVARVGAGASLSVVLITGGLWLYSRDGGRVGAVALATTGFAGLFMVVVAMTSYYHWVRPMTGLVVAGFVAAAAVGLSTYWRSQPMTILAFLAIAGLAPFITEGISLILVGFLLVLQAAGVVPEKLRGWTSIAPVRTVPVVLALLVAQVDEVGGSLTVRVTAAAVCAALGLLCAVLRVEKAEWASAIVYVVGSVPIIAAVPTVERPFNIVVAAAIAVLTVVAMVIARPMGAVTLSAGAIVASLAALEACVATTRGHLLPAMIAVVALGLLSAAHQQRSIPVWSIGVFFATLAGLSQLAYLRASVISDAAYAVRTVGALDAISGVAVAAATFGVVWSARRVISSQSQIPVLLIAPIPALWSVLMALLSTGVAIGGVEGYHAAQLIISALLMAAAMVALNAGLRPESNTGICTVVGLTLVAAALSKLFLYDLAALDGLIRAGSFMAVGLLLLAAGTRYAQAVARRTSDGAVDEGTAGTQPIG